VNPTPKAEDGLHLAIKADRTGIGKHGGIVVGRVQHQEEHFPGRNRRLTQLDGLSPGLS